MVKDLEDEMNQKYFEKYKKMKGKSSWDVFSKNLKVFNKTIVASYCYGEYDRTAAYNDWVRHIDSISEADRYIKVIDSISALT
jgi:hypothetical protein